jgi:asparagine synthetase B (glutamine-hydrolysing)
MKISIVSDIHFGGLKNSEILLEIIYKNGFKVLNDYNGAAALSFYDVKNPDTIYLYHGKSNLYKTTNELIEERPLFYYQAEDNLFYYSSLKESFWKL